MLSSSPDALPVRPCDMVKAYSVVLGAHTQLSVAVAGYGEVVSKTSSLLVKLLPPPNALPVGLPSPHGMVKAYSLILGAHACILSVAVSLLL